MGVEVIVLAFAVVVIAAWAACRRGAGRAHVGLVRSAAVHVLAKWSSSAFIW